MRVHVCGACSVRPHTLPSTPGPTSVWGPTERPSAPMASIPPGARRTETYADDDVDGG